MRILFTTGDVAHPAPTVQIGRLGIVGEPVDPGSPGCLACREVTPRSAGAVTKEMRVIVCDGRSPLLLRDPLLDDRIHDAHARHRSVMDGAADLQVFAATIPPVDFDGRSLSHDGPPLGCDFRAPRLGWRNSIEHLTLCRTRRREVQGDTLRSQCSDRANRYD
jgi:hypothetical protein